MTYRLIDDPVDWNEWAAQTSGSHLLQSWEWGDLKGNYGWNAQRWGWFEGDIPPYAMAQVLQRRMRTPFLRDNLSMAYCPRGPILDWANTEVRDHLITDLISLASERQSVFLKIDPAVPIGYGEAEPVGDPLGQSQIKYLEKHGWKESSEQVQFRNTLLIDLRESEEDLLRNMKQKTRYNVRLAGRHGVTIRSGDTSDLNLLYKMYMETSIRDGFVIRKPEYYTDAWGRFIDSGYATPLIAEVADEPVSAAVIYRFSGTAYFLFGMSLSIHREKMPNYLLQWEAIRWAKANGCDTYDLWGAPDRLDPQDPMWGPYRFKRGFGGKFVRTLGAWDYPLRPNLYWIYTRIWPRILGIMRARGRAQIRARLTELE